MARKNATVTLHADTFQTQWNGVEIGKRFKVDDNGDRYYFVASRIEPTADDSEFAWVTGTRVNGRGKPIEQITHRHCPDGERMELIHVSMIG